MSYYITPDGSFVTPSVFSSFQSKFALATSYALYDSSSEGKPDEVIPSPMYHHVRIANTLKVKAKMILDPEEGSQTLKGSEKIVSTGDSYIPLVLVEDGVMKTNPELTDLFGSTSSLVPLVEKLIEGMNQLSRANNQLQQAYSGPSNVPDVVTEDTEVMIVETGPTIEDLSQIVETWTKNVQIRSRKVNTYLASHDRLVIFDDLVDCREGKGTDITNKDDPQDVEVDMVASVTGLPDQTFVADYFTDLFYQFNITESAACAC